MRGTIKIEICERLGQDWTSLADYFEVPSHARSRFEHGLESQAIWDWLEQRGRLPELPTGCDSFLGMT